MSAAEEDGEERRARWNRRYRERASSDAPPCAVLANHVELLPASGQALEVACGLGGNARLLALRGLEVTAWDYAEEAIARLRAAAATLATPFPLTAQVHDVRHEPPTARSFDVVVVSYFLERALFPALVAALRPGGLLFYETFVGAQRDGRGPADPALRLHPDELPALAAGLEPLFHHEADDCAQLIACRP